MKKIGLLTIAAMTSVMTFGQQLPLPEGVAQNNALGFAGGETVAMDEAGKTKTQNFWGVEENVTKELTFEFWVSLQTGSGQPYYMNILGEQRIAIRTAPKNSIFIYIGGTMCGFIDYPGANANSPVLSKEDWHHIAYTFKEGVIKTYVDGEILPVYEYDKNFKAAGADAAAQAAVVAAAKAAAGERNMIFDPQGNTPPKSFCASVDTPKGGLVMLTPATAFGISDLRYWNTALSGATIKTWYKKYVTSAHPNFSSLQHNWKMNEKYDLGDGNYSLPDRGALGCTAFVKDLAKLPYFLDAENVEIAIPSGVSKAKTLNAAFVVNQFSKTITVTADKLEGVQKVSIFDLSGRLIYKAVETANANTLTIAAPQGMGVYYVQIEGATTFGGKIAITL